ncbi:hypothetical protein GCM10027570_34250 [Streptomonospora sediminis]
MGRGLRHWVLLLLAGMTFDRGRGGRGGRALVVGVRSGSGVRTFKTMAEKSFEDVNPP